MSNLIVNGYTGQAHVRSYDEQGLTRGIIGSGCYALNTESNPFEARNATAAGMYIGPGEGVIQGVHFRVEPGTQQSVAISAGAAGYNRIDLVVARYQMNIGTMVETVDLTVIKGTAVTGTPAVPAYQTCDIGSQQNAATSGVIVCDFPLYTVRLTGTELTSVTKQFEVLPDMAQITNAVRNYKASIYKTDMNGDGTGYGIHLTRTGNVVFCEIGFIGTIPSDKVNKLYTLGNGLIPVGYRPAPTAGRVTIPYFQVASSNINGSGRGQWMINQYGHVTGYTNTSAYIERIGSAAWITEDAYPAG